MRKSVLVDGVIWVGRLRGRFRLRKRWWFLMLMLQEYVYDRRWRPPLKWKKSEANGSRWLRWRLQGQTLLQSDELRPTLPPLGSCRQLALPSSPPLLLQVCSNRHRRPLRSARVYVVEAIERCSRIGSRRQIQAQRLLVVVPFAVHAVQSRTCELTRRVRQRENGSKQRTSLAKPGGVVMAM